MKIDIFSVDKVESELNKMKIPHAVSKWMQNEENEKDRIDRNLEE